MIKSKTFWAGVTGLIDLEIGAAINVGITSVLAIFVRHGVSKVEKKL